MSLRELGKSKAASVFIALRERRRALGLRQIDLAVIAGYNEADINRWEMGREIPRGRCLLNWCDALGVTLMITPRSDAATPGLNRAAEPVEHGNEDSGVITVKPK
jgi:transcriptional regulator with XRE-family HTH domain